MDTGRTNRNKKIIASFVTILAVVIIAEGITFYNHKQATSMSNSVATAQTTSKTSTASPAASSSNATYKDGSYTASGSYLSPGGQETLTVHITLKSDTVTATSIDQTPVTQESEEYQADFKQNYTKLVVGKKINTIQLSRVSGSSLTSQGFNDALKQIETQAAQS
jgi:uncharacterized protein with FMN-binding domain